MMGTSLPSFLLMIVLLSAFAMTASSCGPMNEKKDTEVNSASSTGPSTGIGVTQLSKSSKFYVYAALGESTVNQPTSTPQLGDNPYTFRLAHARDLQPPTESATVTIIYFMPSMPTMGTSEETATRRPDGTFGTTLFFSMSGKWQITVKCLDESVQDEYVFETVI